MKKLIKEKIIEEHVKGTAHGLIASIVGCNKQFVNKVIYYYKKNPTEPVHVKGSCFGEMYDSEGNEQELPTLDEIEENEGEISTIGDAYKFTEENHRQ